MPDSKLQLLQDMPIFGGITRRVLQTILAHAPLRRLRKGEYFFREGDPANSMFVLERGQVVVLKRWQGRNYRLRILRDGDCFGEMALMDLSPRSASVKAVDACIALELSINCLYSIYRDDLEQFTLIQMNMGREVSRRLREADDRAFQLIMSQQSPAVEQTLRGV